MAVVIRDLAPHITLISQISGAVVFRGLAPQITSHQSVLGLVLLEVNPQISPIPKSSSLLDFTGPAYGNKHARCGLCAYVVGFGDKENVIFFY